jgi:hypothetical protein
MASGRSASRFPADAPAAVPARRGKRFAASGHREVAARTASGPTIPFVTYAQEERAALAALLEETGPDGPTLCEGWQTRDLAAHLVLRERRPDAAAGVMGGPLAGYTARVQRQYLSRYSYPELVRLFRSGPPPPGKPVGPPHPRHVDFAPVKLAAAACFHERSVDIRARSRVT